jgi:hypothetical protein
MVSSDPADRYDSLEEALQGVGTDLHAEIARDSFRRLMATEASQMDFFRSFYVDFLNMFPQARHSFFADFGPLNEGSVSPRWLRQFQLLKEAVLLLVVFSILKEDKHEPNILTRIVEDHARRGIPAALYQPFGALLIDNIVLKDEPPPLLTKHQLRVAWTTVVKPGIEYMVKKTNELAVWAYQSGPDPIRRS